jgi:hypothetical protein
MIAKRGALGSPPSLPRAGLSAEPQDAGEKRYPGPQLTYIKEMREINDNVQKWIEALRSGDYKQNYNCALNLDGTYCCLGVACEVYQKEVGDLDINTIPADPHSAGKEIIVIVYDGNSNFLPEKVIKWLGLRTSNGSYDDNKRSLTVDNDRKRKTFLEIADIIESEPEGLFA